MKKLFLMLALTIAFVSCKQKEAPAQEEVATETVDTTTVDSTLVNTEIETPVEEVKVAE